MWVHCDSEQRKEKNKVIGLPFWVINRKNVMFLKLLYSKQTNKLGIVEIVNPYSKPLERIKTQAIRITLGVFSLKWEISKVQLRGFIMI